MGEVYRAGLRLPIFYKVLFANCLIVVIGAVFGTKLTADSVHARPDGSFVPLIVALALVGAALSFAVNFVVLKAALRPLQLLEQTVEEVRRGNLQARARTERFADPQFEQLGETLNAMLETVERYRTQLRELSLEVIEAQEAERKRIARELHDETAQALTSLLIGLRVVERSHDMDEVRERTGELRTLTAQTIDAVRRLAVELRPTTLDNLGLVAAIEAYARDLERKCGTRIGFRAVGIAPEERLAPEVELVVYRVVQEALTNVARHAHAGYAAVTLERLARSIALTVEDDGCGFDPDAIYRAPGERTLGLFGMQERAELLGGRLSLWSAPGRGTRVSVAVPLDRPLADDLLPASALTSTARPTIAHAAS